METHAHLCPVIEGVSFIAVNAGVHVRALILREALEVAFGAGPDPQTWLKAFHAHESAIVGMARVRHALAPRERVVVLRSRHFEHWRDVHAV